MVRIAAIKYFEVGKVAVHIVVGPLFSKSSRIASFKLAMCLMSKLFRFGLSQQRVPSLAERVACLRYWQVPALVVTHITLVALVTLISLVALITLAALVTLVTLVNLVTLVTLVTLGTLVTLVTLVTLINLLALVTLVTLITLSHHYYTLLYPLLHPVAPPLHSFTPPLHPVTPPLHPV